MTIPTTATWDLANDNAGRWDDVVNGATNDLVQLTDLSFVKSMRGVLAELGAYNITDAWLTSTVYSVKDLAKESGNWYIALEDHTSGVFATDLAAGKWGLYQIDFSSNVSLTGDFTVDTDTFHVDSVNNRVGVLTVAPTEAFEVFGNIKLGTAAGNLTRELQWERSGSIRSKMFVDSINQFNIDVGGSTQVLITPTGDVGIGTDAPVFLHGSGVLIQRAGVPVLRLSDISALKAGDIYVESSFLNINGASSGMGIIFHCANIEKARISSIGRMGIGTIDNTTMLSIHQQGTVAAIPVIRLQQDDIDKPFIDYVGTADATTTNSISTLTTSGATTHHLQIDINGTKAWIAASINNPS